MKVHNARARWGLFFVVAMASLVQSYAYCNDSKGYLVLSQMSDPKELRVVGHLQKEETTVVFLKDRSGKLFCVKQLHGADCIGRQFRLVLEAVAARIARLASIPVVGVDIIPQGKKFIGKNVVEQIASLQTVAPGSSFAGCGKFDGSFNIRQRFEGTGFSKEESGLNRYLIYSMSLHPDLPLIVALDTLTSDHDRSRNNISYDRKKNRFCAIDLACSFKELNGKNLGDVACSYIKSYLKDPSFKLKTAEYNALKRYNDTLKQFVKKCPPETMHAIFDQVLSLAELSSCKQLRTRGSLFAIKSRVLQIKKKMVRQYEAVQRLVELIDSLLKKYDRRCNAAE